MLDFTVNQIYDVAVKFHYTGRTRVLPVLKAMLTMMRIAAVSPALVQHKEEKLYHDIISSALKQRTARTVHSNKSCTFTAYI